MKKLKFLYKFVTGVTVGFGKVNRKYYTRHNHFIYYLRNKVIILILIIIKKRQ